MTDQELRDKESLWQREHGKGERDLNRTKGISEYARDELKRMYRELTDDDVIAENKRRADRTARLQEKMDDTGYSI
jgi:hypothetical protein